MELSNIKHLALIDRLQDVLNYLKSTFIGKDEIIDLMGICLIGRENLFLLGPPGTAKSAMVRALSERLQGETFEYLLTRFTEPNELFGPFDIRKLREGDLITNTAGMLPEANLIFLDELLNANSAILNSLLTVLNEKVFRRGKETKELPALMIVSASNHLPEDEALQALFDRFLIRVRCDNVQPDLLNEVLRAGWKLEQGKNGTAPVIEVEDIKTLQNLITQVDLQEIQAAYIDLITKLRNAGLAVSDRRAVKLQRLIAASALICKRTTAILSDMWVLRFIWDTAEQMEVIAGIVNGVTATDTSEKPQNPRATKDSLPNAEEIFKEVRKLTVQWEAEDVPLSEKTIIKDRLRYLNGRSEWLQNEEQRKYVQAPINELWQKIIHTV